MRRRYLYILSCCHGGHAMQVYVLLIGRHRLHPPTLYRVAYCSYFIWAIIRTSPAISRLCPRVFYFGAGNSDVQSRDHSLAILRVYTTNRAPHVYRWGACGLILTGQRNAQWGASRRFLQQHLQAAPCKIYVMKEIITLTAMMEYTYTRTVGCSAAADRL